MNSRLARGILSAHIPIAGPVRPLCALLYRFHVGLREARLWAFRVLWCEPLFRSQCERVGAGFRMESLPYITGRGRIVVGANVRLSGKSSIGFGNRINPRPELFIGNHTFVGHNCHFHVAHSIRIGNHCLLASNVSVRDMDGHALDAGARRSGAPTPRENVRPVVIEDDVWIGTGAMILKGVTVGARSVVGAGAVVTRDVPADRIVAGNPARVVKHLAAERSPLRAGAA